MARLRRGKKSRVARSHIRPGKNVKTRPVLPKKGVSQTAYESGFFDFLMVFWQNNRRMNLCDLTKQVVNLWTALLPRPKISKRILLRDYSEEFEALQREADEENDLGSDSGGTISENGSSKTEEDRSSGSGSDAQRPNRKRKGRKYENYEDYISKCKTKPQPNSETKNEQKTKENTESTLNEPKDVAEFQPMAMPENCILERIVKMDLRNQKRVLNNLEICNPHINPLKLDDTRIEIDNMDVVDVVDDDDDNSTPIATPTHSHSSENRTVKIVKPTKTLMVKNLIEGTTHQDLEETFRLFMNDIVSIQLLNGKAEACAIVGFKTIEAAEKVWLQLNGVEFRRTALDLEFVEVDQSE